MYFLLCYCTLNFNNFSVQEEIEKKGSLHLQTLILVEEAVGLAKGEPDKYGYGRD